MHWVYVLLGKESRLYFGQTDNLQKRLSDHNGGKSVATKPYRPWKIVYLEGYVSKLDALDREKKLKQFGQSYARLKKRIWHSIQDG
ncbi:MAG: GIY-YIG nuclease family protein [bacterium]|nr:GIY-YIG nuclease family protein [bacterium]